MPWLGLAAGDEVIPPDVPGLPDGPFVPSDGPLLPDDGSLLPDGPLPVLDGSLPNGALLPCPVDGSLLPDGLLFPSWLLLIGCVVVDVLTLSAALSSCKNALMPFMPLDGGPVPCPPDIFDFGVFPFTHKFVYRCSLFLTTRSHTHNN